LFDNIIQTILLLYNAMSDFNFPLFGTPNDIYQKLTAAQLGMVLATAAGAASVFPTMPRIVSDMFDPDVSPNAELFRYIALYILILQGGGGFQHDVALVGTVGYFFIVKAMDMLFPGSDYTHQMVTAEQPMETDTKEAPPTTGNDDYFGPVRRF
jgi:hypothetical protein